MLNRVFLLSMLLGTSCLLADAVSIGRTRNGYPLIVPQPKSLEATSGAFVLPAKLTATAPEALDIAPLAKVYAETLHNGAVVRSENGALCSFEITKSGVPQSAEGYTLAVTNSGIAVRAREVHGLFNGMQTLNMMLRHRSEADRLKCCRVTDWPDMPMRGLFL